MKKYEVLIAGQWLPVRGIVLSGGWLTWIDNDNCQGLAPPSKFRPRAETKDEKQSREWSNAECGE